MHAELRGTLVRAIAIAMAYIDSFSSVNRVNDSLVDPSKYAGVK